VRGGDGLLDLAGKASGCPSTRCSAGSSGAGCASTRTPTSRRTAWAQGRRLKERMDAGITFLKMDFGIELIRDVPGALSVPIGRRCRSGR